MGAEADRGGTAPAAGRVPLPPLAPPRPSNPPPPAAPPAPPAPTAVRFHDAGGVAGPPTVRLRPVTDTDDPPDGPGGRRPVPRTVAAVTCLVLGVGLLGGAAAGTLLGGEAAGTTAAVRYDHARDLWHSLPVDTLFPRTLTGEHAGPGGADRTWIRIAVAPDSGCTDAFDPLLAKALSPVGCARLLRATYADETSTSVTTVGIVFTEAGRQAMKDLHRRFEKQHLGERSDLMPRPFAARGTLAADFGDAQRASWTVRVLTDVPAVVYTVTGFADGRSVTDPQPAAQAVQEDETSAPAQAGLGNAAAGIADLTQHTLREEAAAGHGKDAQ